MFQSQFGIVRGPARLWYQEDLTYIMKTCIILRNMIIADERDDHSDLKRVNTCIFSTQIWPKKGLGHFWPGFMTPHWVRQKMAGEPKMGMAGLWLPFGDALRNQVTQLFV